MTPACVRFACGLTSLLSDPLNVRHCRCNASVDARARLAFADNMILALNRVRTNGFIVTDPARFLERVAAKNYFSGEGEFVGGRAAATIRANFGTGPALY